MGLLKKHKASESEEAIKVSVVDTPDTAPVVYEVSPSQPEIPIPVCLVKLGALRDEIKAKRSAIDDHGVAFFCDEVLRALSGLESNLESYCAKARMEALRAANSQGDAK